MSNLLKKASIITTPTAYDDGRILSVKPNENIFGSELVTNGDFATDTDWTKGTGWSIANGKASCDGTQTSNSIFYQNIGSQSNKTVKISFTISNYISGILETSFFGASGTITKNISANGDYTFYINVQSGHNGNSGFTAKVGFVGSVDNVSIVEDLSGDFNFERGSAATRVNAQGLVENVQILSSELVQNGNFSEIGSEEVTNGDFSQEGSELIVNGDFATDSDWTKGTGWSISGGTANCDGTQTGNTSLTQFGAFTTLANKSIKISFTVSNYVAGSVRFISGNGALAGAFISANGVVTLYFNVGANSGTSFNIQGNGDFVGSIDNVSVVEVGQDWTLDTGWSIGEDEAVSDGSQSTISDLEQNITLNQGSIYLVEFDLIRSAGTLYPKVGDTTGTGLTSTQSVSQTIVAGSSNKLELRADVNFIGSITNISVKEVLQDWASINANIYLSNNQLVVDDTANLGVDSRAYQTVPTIIGAKYRLTFDRISTTSSFWLAVGSGNPSPYKNIFYQQLGTDTGIYELEFVALTTTTTISLITGGTGISIFDNVSLLQVTDDTDLPRINYEGFSYQDVLGSEKIINNYGNFPNQDAVDYFSIAQDGGTPRATKSLEDGFMRLTYTGTNGAALIKANLFPSGKTYRVKFRAKGTANTNFNSIGDNYNIPSNPQFVISNPILTSDWQDYEFTVPVSSTTCRFYLNTVSAVGSTLDITNISVKEVTGQEVVPNSGCGSWLFEPQSTNLFPYSEDFTQWDKVGTTVIANSIISPSGTLNSDKIEETSGGTYHNVNEDFGTLSSGSTYTASAFYKSAERTSATIYENLSTGGLKISSFNLTNGTVISEDAAHTATIKDYGNGWYKCSITFTLNASRSGSVFYGTNDTLVFTGVSGNGVYIWGAQYELLSYATSYIPTDGAASTRLQDIANNSGNSDLFNDSEGVLYAEIAALDELDITARYIQISDGTSTANGIQLRYYTSTNLFQALYYTNGAYQSVLSYTLPNSSEFNKMAFKYKQNDFALWVDGLEVGTDASGLTGANLSNLSFDYNGFSNFYGKTKALAVFKEALTDTELELLTAPAPEFPTFTLDFDTIAEQFTFTRGSEATFVNEQGLIQSTNEIGSELVTNGDFATDLSGWSLTNPTGVTVEWTSSGMRIATDGTGGGATQVILEIGKTYLIEFDYTAISGSLKLDAIINTLDTTKKYSIVKTATQAPLTFYRKSGVAEGIIDNVSVKEVISATNTPRIDYSTGEKAFLLEPQSTNLITYSEDFSNASWNVFRGSVTSNIAISPDGTLNASRYEEDSQTGSHLFRRQSLSITNGLSYTGSIFAKKGELSSVTLQSNSSSRWVASANFNLENGTVTSGTGVIENYGNGWYRCSISGNAVQTTSDAGLEMYTSTGAGRDGDGLFMYGAQFEQSTYPTSYIPTNGASATRNQETCSNATPTINSEEGVLYAEISALANDGTSRRISLSDGSISNRVSLEIDETANRIRVHINSSLINYDASDLTSFNKIAVKYKVNDYALWLNGVEVATSSSSEQPSGMNVLSFTNPTEAQDFYGNTKGLQVFDKALSDYQLKQLTTI